MVAVIVGAVLYYALGGLWYSPRAFSSVPALDGQTTATRTRSTFVIPAITIMCCSVPTGHSRSHATTTLLLRLVLGLTVGSAMRAKLTFIDAGWACERRVTWFA